MTIDELEQCIQLYGKDIYAFCGQLACSRPEAEDLYQDTFVKATEQLQKLSMSGNPKSYLLSVALRIWKNKKRKYAWRQRIAPTGGFPEDAKEFISPEPSAEDMLIFAETSAAVWKAVRKLDDRYRIPTILYYTEQLSTREIASVMKLPDGTVKSRLHHARKLLKKELEVFIHEA